MKNFCNKFDDSAKVTNKQENKEEECPIFPPGCDCEYLKDKGIKCRTAEESKQVRTRDGDFKKFSYVRGETFDKELYEGMKNSPADNMSGSFKLISVPEVSAERRLMTMPYYLDGYRGKYICLDLWTNEKRRVEKCGVLKEVGEDFISIKNLHTNNVTMIDLRSVRYISIYCR